MMYGMQCGHRFCKKCWSKYLTRKIVEEGTEGVEPTISCAFHNCPTLVDDKTVMELVSNPTVKLKYQRLITTSFVGSNHLIRWCINSNCTNAIRVEWEDWRPVRCTCGQTFCFRCGEVWHDPVKCEMLLNWLAKCKDDSLASNYIVPTTKKCPECGVTIEKEGGCNHMVCRNQNCNAEFCWVCLGPWDTNGSCRKKCNRFDFDKAPGEQKRSRRREALESFLFYYTRHMNHVQSARFEMVKLYPSVLDKMEEEMMQQYKMPGIKVDFFHNAIQNLWLCRQTLYNSYIFAFHLSKTDDSAVFEDVQGDLESATERLSEYLERNIGSKNLVDIKQKLQDKYRYCDRQRHLLHNYIHDGYEKGLWVYNF